MSIPQEIMRVMVGAGVFFGFGFAVGALVWAAFWLAEKEWARAVAAWGAFVSMAAAALAVLLYSFYSLGSMVLSWVPR